MATLKGGKINIAVNLIFKISFWQAVKLRIAGKYISPVVKEILYEMKESIANRGGKE